MVKRNRPNVIVFFTDQQRWDTLGANGNPAEITPNLDRYAKYGTNFEHAFTCQPVCGPARSCVQSGLYATTTGCYRNGIPLPSTTRTLGSHFQSAGYQTAYIGKWHLASSNPVAAAERQGYDHWLGSNALEHTSDAYDTSLYDGDGHRVRLPGYRVDALTDAAIRYIDGHADDPFFLFLSFLEPHHQNHRDDYPAPVGYRERYAGKWMPPDLAALGGTAAQQMGGYMGMIKRLDEAFGRLTDCLTSLKLLEDTIIVFTSDHGNHFKTRNREYKRSCHDSSIRVPMVIGGRDFNGGGTVQELVSLIDLPPTLLDAAGIAVPDEMQGKSVLPLVRRTPVSWPEEVFVQISESQIGRCIRTKRWKYSVSAPEGENLRKPSATSYVEEFLYDLASDPYELTNLIDKESHKKVAAVLRERLLERIYDVEAERPTIQVADKKPSGQRIVFDEELPFQNDDAEAAVDEPLVVKSY